jgi:hypothetical protein
MGALPVKNYQLAKAVRKQDHATQRIPVGMADSLWQAILKQSQVDAMLSHATWAGRRIAYWVETRRRMGTGVEDSLVLLESVPALADRLALYNVPSVLKPFAMRLAKDLVMSGKLRPRKEQADAN